MESLLPLLFMFALLMLPMVWLSSRQRKMQQQQMEAVSQLGIGDEVRTHSGFYGIIVEEFGDQVILETENGAQMKWDRRAISGLAQPTDPAAEAATADGAEADRLDPALEDRERIDPAPSTVSDDFSTPYDDSVRREDPAGTSESDGYEQDRRQR